MSKTRIIEGVKQLDVETVRDLLDAKPSLLTVVDQRGFNLLHLACCVPCADLGIAESVSAKMATLLLDRGLDVESQLPPEKDKCTALFFAVARGRNTTLIKLLLKRGAKVANAPGGGLFAAAWWDSPEHLGLLLRAGANIEQKAGATPFLAAWNWRKFEAAKFLANKGADVNVRDPKTGKTALHYGVEKEFDPALLAWLVEHGASADIKDRDGVTARDRASRKRDKKWLAALT
jgi:ankyrin repeat protein